MRTTVSTAPVRRIRRLAERRTRRRPALVAATLAVGLLATACFNGTLPTASAETGESAVSFTLASYSAPAEVVVVEPATGSTELVTDARDAIATAEASLAAAESVSTDIAATGLDIGIPDTSIDTAELASAADRLELGTEARHTLFLPGLTEDVTELVAPVDARVAQLRGSLDAAIARKAAEEAAAAAEQARIEAEAAIAAAAAAERAKAPAAPSAPNPVYATGGVAGDNSPGGAQASARAMLPSFGWGDDQFGCLVSLWNKESGWNYQAYNRSSGATGIPQALPGSKMASAGSDWQVNAATQVRWGLGYIANRYGTPCSAWSHSQSVGGY